MLARIGGDDDRTNVDSRQRAADDAYTEHPDLPVHLALGTATAEKNNLTKEFTFADQRMYADKAARK